MGCSRNRCDDFSAELQPSLVFREERVEPLAIDLVLDLLGADENGETDPGEEARFLLGDPDVDERLHEHFLANEVDAALELGHDRVGASPATDGGLGFVVDGDGDVAEQVDAVERIWCGVDLLFELVHAALGPLLEKGGVELADAAEVGIEAAGGDAYCSCAEQRGEP